MLLQNTAVETPHPDGFEQIVKMIPQFHRNLSSMVGSGIGWWLRQSGIQNFQFPIQNHWSNKVHVTSNRFWMEEVINHIKLSVIVGQKGQIIFPWKYRDARVEFLFACPLHLLVGDMPEPTKSQDFMVMVPSDSQIEHGLHHLMAVFVRCIR